MFCSGKIKLGGVNAVGVGWQGLGDAVFAAIRRYGIHHQIKRNRIALNAFVVGKDNQQAGFESANLVLLNDYANFAGVQLNQAAYRVNADALNELIDYRVTEYYASHAH